MNPEHFKKLERMYHSASINRQVFENSTINIEDGLCEISLEVSEKYFHGGQALHGSVYFKLLDDAAYFAINSKVFDEFLLTFEFNAKFIRPVTGGILRCTGKYVSENSGRFDARSELYNDNKLVARGSGIFVKSGSSIESVTGYM